VNTNLLNIVKQIIATHGEGVLADPQKLKPLFSDYAKNESKEERIAFGRCVEMGAYWELKNSSSPAERWRKKNALADQLHTKTGIDKAQCVAALDLLEASMGTQSNQQSILPSGIAANIPKISRRTVNFGIAGAVGAGIGSLVTEGFTRLSHTYLELVLHVARWSAFMALGISVGLLLVQNLYLKRKPEVKSIVKTALIGLIVGAVSGAIAQIIFGFSLNASMFVIETVRAICWGIMGLGIGWGVSKFVPNFPLKRAVAAGLLGGVIGGAAFVFIAPHLPGAISRFIGVAFLGLFIGMAISYIEEALREAWITVIWGPKETRTIALGGKPILFGSSPEADIHLPKDKEPPIRAAVQIENSRIVMYDKKTGQSQVLQDGARVDFGKISFVVSTKNRGGLR